MRTIQAPGIELNEIDRSQYNNKPDYSLTNAPACFICGFADKGENYTMQWINSKNTLIDTFGYPTTPEETYFYNAGVEILSKGGVCLMSKLPYNNDSLTSIPYCEYGTGYSDLADIENSTDVKNVDGSLGKVLKFKSTGAGLDSIQQYDRYNTDRTLLGANKFRIYDIYRNKYDKASVQTNGGSFTECEILGVVPVVSFSKNALFYQNIVEHDNRQRDAADEIPGGMFTYNIGEYNLISEIRSTSNQSLDISKDNFTVWLSSDYGDDQTISRDAARMFPAIQHIRSSVLDRKYLRHICVTVFIAYKDTSNGDKISLKMVESFSGSLKKGEIDRNTKKNVFIDDVVNQGSNYINFFSNISQDLINSADIFSITNQYAYSLGFTEAQSTKDIDFVESIQRPLTMIFDRNSDINIYQLDIVVDAGLTTIANKAKGCDENLTDCGSSASVGGWTAIAQKFDEFCRYQRRDCVFILDAPKKFCLDGDSKKIRRSLPERTIANTIIPQLKYLTRVNSSYTAGYCDWFLTTDAYTGDLFWCPPSIKAAGVYINTDVYSHKWDAPAGLNRGVIRDVVDCAFSPTNDEAGQIYQNSWNYAVNYPLDGIVLEGQRTLQRTPSALDRINVRRLMLHLERQVTRISRFFKYEANTAYNRQRFVDQIKPVLEDARTGYGVIDYAVRCDETNNTAKTIDNNELHCAIAVKPVKTIEFIVLNFICTNQSASVTEEVVK